MGGRVGAGVGGGVRVIPAWQQRQRGPPCSRWLFLSQLVCVGGGAHSLGYVVHFDPPFAVVVVAPMAQHLLLAGSPDEMVALERVAATRDMLSWVPPPKALFDSFWAPYSFVLRPDVEGLEGMVEQLNGRPALFVMNHSLGGIEMPITIRYIAHRGGGGW